MNAVSGEIDAIAKVHDALESLDDQARRRILAYIGSLFGIDVQPTSPQAEAVEKEDDGGSEKEADRTSAKPTTAFSSFAEFYAAANPKTEAEKALVAGYWLQECKGTENFASAMANKELMNLGHKVGNITRAFDAMKGRNPALILQLKKRGSSRQARKVYQVSYEGKKRVEEMVSG